VVEMVEVDVELASRRAEKFSRFRFSVHDCDRLVASNSEQQKQGGRARHSVTVTLIAGLF
jgi:hypothetical protein